VANDSNPISGGLVSLEGLTKPATVLIEKISDAIGALHRPRQIVREAHAEAEVEKIKALAQIEITEIQRRGMGRFIEQQGKQQENFENIVAQALPDLEGDAKPEEIDNDWMAHFFEAAKLVSDQEMQSLWARLLAGEANKAGSFTKRTLELVSNLDKYDAELFTDFCTFVWRRDRLIALILDTEHQVYQTHGINFGTLTHLDDIGLVKFNDVTGFVAVNLHEFTSLNYQGTLITLELPEGKNDLEIGKVLLTQVGQELAPISGSSPDIAFLEYVIRKWIEEGYRVTSPLPKQTSIAGNKHQ
jgi:hypothetical protein